MAVTLYDILGISSTASAAEIKTAFKKLAKQYHPDKNPGSMWHEEQFKRVNQAYQILSDAQQKRLYDYKLEYELFNRQKTYSTPKERYHNTNEYQRPPVTQKPPVARQYKTAGPILKGKEFSESKINILVISYYVLIITLLGLYFNYREDIKIRNNFDLAAEYEENGQYINAIGAYNAILLLDKKNVLAYEKNGEAKLKAGLGLLEALDDFDRAIGYSALPGTPLLLKRARLYAQLTKYDLALIDLEQILSRTDKIDSAYFYKAEINFLLQNYEVSIPNYTAFIRTTPNSGEAHMRRAFCYFQKKSYQAALNDYNFTIKWQPENGENYYYRAFSKFALQDSSSACRDLHDSFLLGYNEAGKARSAFCDHYELIYE